MPGMLQPARTAFVKRHKGKIVIRNKRKIPAAEVRVL